MKTAIITGASSGLGKEFAKQLNENFKEIDEFILIARRKEKLEEISKSLEGKKVVILSLDLMLISAFPLAEGQIQEFL